MDGNNGKRSRYKISRNPPPSLSITSPFLKLPPELLSPIVNHLPFNDALSFRLACKSFTSIVDAHYKSFQIEICGDSLNLDQLHFISRINLKKITFKRIAKPLNSPVEPDFLPDNSWMFTRSTVFDGPSQYFQVGGIQIRSISAPRRYIGSKYVYDHAKLRNYLCQIGRDDIFRHM